MFVRASLSDVKRSVNNAYGHGLIFQGEKFDVAIWGVGNCLIIARKEADAITDVILNRFRLITSPIIVSIMQSIGVVRNFQ